MALSDTLNAQMVDMSPIDIFNFILIGATIGMMLAMLIIVYMCKSIRSPHYANVALNYCPIVVPSKNTTPFNSTDIFDNNNSKVKQK
ncbi:hypothetical protein ACH3XW_25685 [Acanthocheilonema viteae]